MSDSPDARVPRRCLTLLTRFTQGRMDALESRMSSMQDLFELERTRTAELLVKERAERARQEEKVRALEEDLFEQARKAREAALIEAAAAVSKGASEQEVSGE